MNRKILTALLTLLPLLCASHQSSAQEICKTVKNPQECEEEVQKKLLREGKLATQASPEDAKKAIADLTATKARVEGEAKRELLSKVAPEVAVLPGASAAFEDFLNRLRIGVSSSEDSGIEGLALDFTDFLGLSTEDGYKLQAVARDPVLYEPLATQLSEENRDKRTKGLGSFDDVLVTFAYSPSTPRLGKNLGANQILIDELFQTILAGNESLARAATEAAVRREGFVPGLATDFPAAFSQGELQDFKLITDESRQAEYREAVEQAAVAEATRLDSMSKILDTTGFFNIADLVANQPQLVAKATTSIRADLIGPEESTLNISYEQGFVNMNSLRKALKRCSTTIGSCFASYLTPERIATAEGQNRFTVSLDWTRRRDYREAVDGASVDTEGNERWTFEAAYGRNVRRNAKGDFTSRFDFTGSWEDWSDDPLHQDRGLAKVSFTQKVTGDMSLVLGAVWASKAEFRGEVDKEVSARFGFTYRLLDKEGKEIVREGQ